MSPHNGDIIEAQLLDDDRTVKRYVATALIAYFFLAGAEHVITAPWNGRYQLRPRTVYFQTTEGQTYRAVRFHSLEAIKKAFSSPRCLAPAQRSVLVHVGFIGTTVGADLKLPLADGTHTILASGGGFKAALKSMAIVRPHEQRKSL